MLVSFFIQLGYKTTDRGKDMNATWLAVSEEDLRGNEGSGSDYGQDWDLPHKF